jgi:hypothetical protein
MSWAADAEDPRSACDAVDGSRHWHRGAKLRLLVRQPSMNEVTTIGLDLAKKHGSVAGNMDLESAIRKRSQRIPACAPKSDLSLMPTEFPDDGTIDELLRLAGVSTEHSRARGWLESALAAARGTLELGLTATGFTRVPQPSPAKHNAPLDKIERASGRLIAALEQLKGHPYAHASFWRFAAFGPVYVNGFKRPDVMGPLTKIRDAARRARVSRTGRPPDFRKQHIVDLALAFCARFSRRRPSSDVNNFFPAFAERFFELSTGLSVEDRGHGVGRQITVALKRWPLERERAEFLNKTHLI